MTGDRESRIHVVLKNGCYNGTCATFIKCVNSDNGFAVITVQKCDRQLNLQTVDLQLHQQSRQNLTTALVIGLHR